VRQGKLLPPRAQPELKIHSASGGALLRLLYQLVLLTRLRVLKVEVVRWWEAEDER
jgi:hypothetical protein